MPENNVYDVEALTYNTNVYTLGLARHKSQDNKINDLYSNTGKNRLKLVELGSSDANHGTTVSINGVNFTVNTDGTISAYRTSTSSSGGYVFLYSSTGRQNCMSLFDGQHVWSGYPSGYTTSQLMIWYNIGNGSNQSLATNGITLPDANGQNVRIGMQITSTFSPTQSDPVIIKPMICLKEEYEANSSFEPWSPSNRELYEMILALQTGA